MLQDTEITLSFNEVLTNFDLQRFIDVLDDYYQAVVITPQEEWDKRLTTALGLDLWAILVDAGHDIVARVESAKKADQAATVTLEAEAAPRIYFAAKNIRSILECDILSILHPYYLDIADFGLRERMLLDDFGWFSDGGFEDISVDEQKMFWAAVKELGKIFADQIESAIATRTQGDLFGQALLTVFTGDQERATRAVRRFHSGQPEQTITVKALAEMHGVNISTARRWCDKGKIEAQKRGRDWFILEDVAKAFEPPKSGRPRKE